MTASLAREARLLGINPARLGHCYELAGRFILDEAPPDAVLVHGSIQGGKNPRIGHAWVEHDGNGTWEPASGIWWPRSAFFAFLRPRAKQQYTKDEARWHLLKAKQWGPWTARQRACLAMKRNANGTHAPQGAAVFEKED